MYNVVMSKIRVYAPGRKGSANANREYLKYIATRDGVDLSDADMEMSENGTYLDYIGNRPGSQGLFGNACARTEEVAAEIYSQTKNNNVIYRGIVSLDPRDAGELGYYRKKNWQDLLNAAMPDIADVFHIPVDRMRWVAAFHMEESHPHVHYMLWDSECRVRSPYIHVAQQDKCRGILSEEVFRVERQVNARQKTAARDLALEYGKDVMEDARTGLMGLLGEGAEKNIPVKVRRKDVDELSEKLIRLTQSLPEKGAVKYSYMPPDVKRQADEMADMVLSRKQISKEYEKYMACAEKSYLLYSKNYNLDQIRENADKDIKKRISNIVLKAADRLRKESFGFVMEEDGLEEVKEAEGPEDAVPDADYGKALSYFAKAAENKNAFAFYSMGKIYENPESGHYDIRKAEGCYRHAADAGNHYAEYALGKLYYRSELKNIEMSEHWLCKAAEGGNSQAWYLLGKLYADSRLYKYNIDRSIECMGRACMEGDAHAMYALAKIYLLEDYGRYRPQEGMALLRQAAGLGNSYAELEIGKQYVYGKAVGRDREEAERWIQKSIDHGNEAARQFREDMSAKQSGIMLQRSFGLSCSILMNAYRGMRQQGEEKRRELEYSTNRAKKKKKHEEQNKMALE